MAYDLRPAKQSERRIIIDILRIAGDCALPIRDYRYVGMGANRFYDFILFHKYLGISNMVSIEGDPKMLKRAEFNVPFGFIDVRAGKVGAFLDSDTSEGNTIYWLDYDGGIGTDVVSDISALMSKLRPGDIFFVSANGQPPHAIDTMADAGRLAWLGENVGPTAGGLELVDVENARFWLACFKILKATAQHGLSSRQDGKLLELLQAHYSDGTPMVTIGGIFTDDQTGTLVSDKLSRALPFLAAADPVYKIETLHLTDKERVLFDLAVTRAADAEEKAKLLELGFKERQLAAYFDLMRYLPRYVETHI